MAEKNVHGGHRKRLRDRALTEGLDGFDPHQVMELLLFYAIPRQDTSEHAHRLIDRFGSVHAVLTAQAEELMEIPGIGARTAEWLTKVGALVESYGNLKSADRPAIGNLRQALAFCTGRICSKCAPRTFHICLTHAGAVQVMAEMCASTAWGEPGALKRCLDDVLSANARNVIIAVRSEDAVPEVEDYDRKVARQFGFLLKSMGAMLVDVILIGSERMISMSQTGDYNRNEGGDIESALSKMYLREDDSAAEEGDMLPLNDDGL